MGRKEAPFGPDPAPVCEKLFPPPTLEKLGVVRHGDYDPVITHGITPFGEMGMTFLGENILSEIKNRKELSAAILTASSPRVANSATVIANVFRRNAIQTRVKESDLLVLKPDRYVPNSQAVADLVCSEGTKLVILVTDAIYCIHLSNFFSEKILGPKLAIEAPFEMCEGILIDPGVKTKIRLSSPLTSGGFGRLGH